MYNDCDVFLQVDNPQCGMKTKHSIDTHQLELISVKQNNQSGRLPQLYTHSCLLCFVKTFLPMSTPWSTQDHVCSRIMYNVIVNGDCSIVSYTYCYAYIPDTRMFFYYIKISWFQLLILES